MDFGPYHVKNVRSWVGRSGYGFSATLYNEKEKIALLTNEGRGGATFIEEISPIEKDNLTSFVDNIPLIDASELGLPSSGETKVGLEMFLGALIDQWETNKRIKRKVKTHTLFRLREDPPTTYRTMRIPFSEHVRQMILTKHGESVTEIINDRF